MGLVLVVITKYGQFCKFIWAKAHLILLLIATALRPWQLILNFLGL